VISLASHVFVLKNLRHPFLPSSKFIKCQMSLCYLVPFFCLCGRGCSCCDWTYGLYVIYHVLAIIVFVVLDDLIGARNLSQCRAVARYCDTHFMPITLPYRSRLRFCSPPFHPFATFHSFTLRPSFEPTSGYRSSN